MKKILTLSIALVAVTGAFAQYPNSYPNRTENRDVILGGGTNDRTVYDNGNSRYDNNSRYNNNNSSAKERDFEIQRINREFDYKIRDVQSARRMRSSEKSYQVRLLEQQRRQQVQAVRDRFQGSRNRNNSNPYARNDRRW
ncbi:MAG: hypothetical protein JWR72_1710 [Flavisolibacter sp.]|jgi:hypothetical protein|nr:hypothetical protein [Flavisolibacter sp.]